MMKLKTGFVHSIVRWMRGRSRGQAMVAMLGAVVGLLAVAGLAVDMGHVYYAYQQLLASTQISALAGAEVLMTGTATSAISEATTYSAVSGDKNAISGLSNVTMVSGYPKVKCLSSIGTICTAYPSGDNAIAVSQTASVPTIFLGAIGIKSIPITVTATAAAAGGAGGPYNVAIILDTTASMNNTDSDSQCNSSRLACAEAGIQTLLQTLSPCAAGLTSCGTASTETITSGANVPNPVDEVGLYVFPGLTSSSYVTDDYVCPTSNPPTSHYNSSPVYQIIPFSSNYRTSDSATTLNSSADLVIAVGGGSCSGMKAPGGQGTFYAGVIDAAQAALVANARTNTKNVMIILSDGDANASASQMSNTNSPYPQTQQCHQAITEAQKAATAGTIVYSVAYGATSSGCSTDTSPTITPCQTMEQIASSSQNFFSDYTATGGSSSCVSAARPTSNLNQIFQQIGQSLTVARLIPNSAT